ncbi:MAG: L,D-transpeptidase family protein [Clostridiales bacterium]|nr:L,D-transpeptidase family protein [Clostridiales bacterium]
MSGWRAALLWALAATLLAGCAAVTLPGPPEPGASATAQATPTLMLPTPTAAPTPTATPPPTAVPTPAATPATLCGVVRLSDTGSAVNIRGGPGTQYDILGKIGEGTNIEITQVGFRWHRIVYEGGTGYITADEVALDARAAAAPLSAIIEERAQSVPAHCGQIILSLVEYDTGYLWVLEKGAEGWQITLGPFEANMGANGPGKTKAGDKKTPLGVFTPDIAFGMGDAPDGVSFPWRAITPDSLWIGDSDSKYYNKWVEHGSVPLDYDTAECERLLAIQPQYELALNYGYNPECTPNTGSALFLHVWKARGVSTAGCTAVSRDAMLAILRRLDPAMKPVFMQFVMPGN